LPVIIGGVEKMSKSKNNVVEPKEIISEFGADTARLFTIFAGPPDQDTIWSDSGVEGAFRFLRRLWSFAYDYRAECGKSDQVEDVTESKRVRHEVHRLLQQINRDFERLQYNTVVSGAMKMLKALEGTKTAGPGIIREGVAILLQVLHPVTPHISQVLWVELGFAGNVHESSWPIPNEEVLKQDEVKMMVQVNGKLRGEIIIEANAEDEVIRLRISSDPILRNRMEGASRMIVVPNRLVNFIV
jgi:leucyl-tRNA synthetase